MIITGTVNLQTVNLETLVEIGEAVSIAMEQRKQGLRKTFRKHGPLALSDFEKRVIGVEEEFAVTPTFDSENIPLTNPENQ